MANGLTLTEVKAYRDYVQTYSAELMMLALQGFRTAQWLTEDNEVQGKKTFSVMKSTGMVLKPFSTTYNGSAHIEMLPRTIETHVSKGELDIVPSDIRASYLGFFTLPNQDVLPVFLQKIVSYFLMQIATDIDKMVWACDTDGTGIMGLFDGIAKQLKNAVTANELTPIATGAITASNVITSLEAVYDGLSEDHRNSLLPTYIYTSKKVKDLYIRANRDAYTKYTNDQKVVVSLLGTETTIVDVPAWSGTNKVLATAKANLIFGYDKNLNNPIKVIDQHYHIEHSLIREFGTLVAKPWDGEASVNDQI
jgi:hypothetical protein